MVAAQEQMLRNKKAALVFVEAMASGDADTAAGLLKPEAYMDAKGSGRFSGRRDFNEIVASIGAVEALVPGGFNPRIESVTAEENRVVVEWSGDSRTVTGTPYSNDYCMVFHFDGGLINAISEFFCNVHAEQVLGPLLDAKKDVGD